MPQQNERILKMIKSNKMLGVDGTPIKTGNIKAVKKLQVLSNQIMPKRCCKSIIVYRALGTEQNIV